MLRNDGLACIGMVARLRRNTQGTMNQTGAFLMRVEKVGADMLLSQIVKMVGDACCDGIGHLQREAQENECGCKSVRAVRQINANVSRESLMAVARGSNVSHPDSFQGLFGKAMTCCHP